MPSTGRALFVYYKVQATDGEVLAAGVRAMQAALMQDDAGLRARLWMRSDSAGDQATWMESYEHPLGIDDAMVSAIDRAAQDLPEGRRGERHLEMFVNL